MPISALNHDDGRLSKLMARLPGTTFHSNETASDCDCTSCVEVIEGSLGIHGKANYDKLLVKGDLKLPGNQDLRRLPRLLVVTGDLDLSDCPRLELMPEGLYVGMGASFDRTPIERLPRQTLIEGNLNLDGCEALTEIHSGVSFRSLHAKNAASLARIEGPLDCRNIHLGGTKIAEIPAGVNVSGELDLCGCEYLTSIAEGVTVKGQLDVTGCTALFKIPKSIQPDRIFTDAFYVTNDALFGPFISRDDAEMMVGRPAGDVIRHHLFDHLEIMKATIVSVGEAWSGGKPNLPTTVRLDTPERRRNQRLPNPLRRLR